MKKTKALILTLVLVSVVIVVLNVLLFAAGKPEEISDTNYFYSEEDYNGYLTANGFQAENSDKKFVSAAVQKVGEQTREDKYYFLYLELRVTFDTASSVYQIDASVRWDKKSSYAGSITAEGTALDFLAVTWGGAGGLCATDKNMSGKYYGSDETEIFSTRNSDSYNGVVWQFEERNGLYGKILEEGSASVTLKPVEANITVREAGIRLTYIHTAHKTGYGMMSMDYGQRGAYAPRILYETVGDSFKTELCIEDLKF